MGAGWMEGQEVKNGRVNRGRNIGLNLLPTWNYLFREEIPKSSKPPISPFKGLEILADKWDLLGMFPHIPQRRNFLQRDQSDPLFRFKLGQYPPTGRMQS